MRGPRRRTRARTRSHGLITYTFGFLLVGALVVGASLPSASFSRGEAPRGANIDVVGDENAVLALDTAQEVRINRTSDLTNVTNRFGRDVAITVTLRNDSTDIGDLVVDGVSYGNEVSFTLAQDGTETIRITVSDDSSLTDETVSFHVEASAPGLTSNAPDREVPVNG